MSSQAESMNEGVWKRPKRAKGGLRQFTVTVELPRQTLEAWSHSASEAEWETWHAIGLAGVKHYGTLKAEPGPPPAPPAVTHTGPPV